MFLEQVSLIGEQDDYDEDESSITLMTLHIAKGLEFPVVFIVGLEDGIFPHYRSMTDSAELEEERRLLYVGITRAQQRYTCATHGAAPCSDRRTSIRLPVPERAPREPPRGSRGRRAGLPRPLAAAGRLPRRSRPAVGGVHGRRTAGQVEGGRAPTGSWAPPGRAEREVPSVSEGDTVVHERWGEGVVLTVKGYGDDAEATIAFSDAGEKRLLLSYAPLKRVG